MSLDGSASEPNLDPEKVRDLFANVLKIDQTLGDYVPAKDVADDADVLKTMLGASAEELEPNPKPTGEDDPHDNASDAGSSGRASPKAAATASARGSSVKPTIAKTRRVPPPSALPLSASSKGGGPKTGKRTIGAPSSKPIASATTTGGLGNDCDDSDGDEVFQSSKYDSEASDNDDANVATNKSTSSSRSGKSKRAPRRPKKKKESESEKAERLLREREESKRVLRLQKTQMRSTQLTRRSSALEVLDGLIPLGHNKPNIGFTRQHMVEHAMERLSQKRTLPDSNDATPTTADKNLDVRVCRYLEKDPEAPMKARERVSLKIAALRKASSIPGALGVLETRRLLCDPEWLPIDDALHKRKDASHGAFRKLDGAVRELRQQKELEALQAHKRETWIAAALATAAK